MVFLVRLVVPDFKAEFPNVARVQTVHTVAAADLGLALHR
jgi:hypothetical protein